jgi:hypothetical protein
VLNESVLDFAVHYRLRMSASVLAQAVVAGFGINIHYLKDGHTH